MSDRATPQSVAAVITAYNEAARIGAVLDVIVSCPVFSEVIVVDDGSTDGTDSIVASYPVLLIRNKVNCGKGSSMVRAVSETKASIIFFCDADIKGLNHRIIKQVLEPTIAGTRDMKIAQRSNPLYNMPFVLAMTPKLGGIRAVTRQLWEAVPPRFKRRFMIEAALNHFARSRGKGFEYVIAEGVSQVIKEKKYGWLRGLVARMKMCGDVALAYAQLTMH
jgi:glycosyltransferase involved in cell wall biosynthesis